MLLFSQSKPPINHITDDQKYKQQEIKSDADSAKEDSVDEDDPKLVIKEEPESQHDEPDTMNNLSQASSCDYNLSQFKDEPPFSADEGSEKNYDSESQDQDYEKPNKFKPEPEDSEEDIPLVGFCIFGGWVEIVFYFCCSRPERT